MLAAVALLVAAFAPDDSVTVTRALVVGPVLRRERAPFSVDAVLARVVEDPSWHPRSGEALARPEGTQLTWTESTAGEDGSFRSPSLAGGYLAATVTSPRRRTVLLEAKGNGMAYVNGLPRAGDVYAYGYAQLPFVLEKGENRILMPVSNGRASIRLYPVASELSVSTLDPTLPDLVVGEPAAPEAAVLVTNASEDWMDATATARVGDTTGPPRPVRIPPMTVRKVRVTLPSLTPTLTVPIPMDVEIRDQLGEARATARFDLNVKHPREPRKVTFVSEIDGSVQYYAVLPADAPAGPGKALVLSVHGASVEATSQAGAYGPKTWAHVVCPTNRRPYGFNWEDQGRLDALEVLAHAQRTLATDPSRTYLTGHSMGGHGTWYIGMTDPDLWGAIAPAAGWVSVWSYAGAVEYSDPTPVERELRRAANLSDTLLLLDNTRHFGVYVLHGDADETVPVAEARGMRERLAAFHRDVDWHEEPGGGHWYDTTPEPGADCVDYPPLFAFLERRRVRSAADVDAVRFTTVSPGVNGRCHWATVARQPRPLEPSRVELRLSRALATLSGTTENVDRLEIDPGRLKPGAALAIDLDGTRTVVSRPPSGPIRLERFGGAWREVAEFGPGKRPSAYGPFKDAFRHRFALIVGTSGTAEETAWNLAKAVYDSETFWYRGNGSVDVYRDTEVELAELRGRNLVLYGHRDSNGMVARLVGESPVQIGRGWVQVGERRMDGDFGCLFVRPWGDRLVAVVAGSGERGRRIAERTPLFAAGVHLPDYLVVDPSAAGSGSRGVLAAGFFDGDWGLPASE